MKKILAILMTIAVAGLVLGGCTGDDSGEADNGETDTSSDEE